ncbi:hypothetical protein ALT721_560011 [Alteromonas alvinellae]
MQSLHGIYQIFIKVNKYQLVINTIKEFFFVAVVIVRCCAFSLR